jgi:ABC-2 type transport system ATP-binding protein
VTIEVDGLVHRYGDLAALDGVSFAVKAGEVFGYLGPNGAGKSTTVRILLGLLHPTAGSVRVAGIDVLRDPVAARAAIGYLPELVALYEGLTPREHLEFVGRVRRMDDALARRRGLALLEAFGLTAWADEPVRSFSKGMRQRAGLALALLHRPPVLVLDEPLSGLDAQAALVLKEVLRGFAARGTSILYCSHVLDVVERVCDRAMILSKGKAVAHGSIAELRASTRGTSLEEVFRSVAADADPTATANALLAAMDA